MICINSLIIIVCLDFKPTANREQPNAENAFHLPRDL